MIQGKGLTASVYNPDFSGELSWVWIEFSQARIYPMISM
jgi:hypothetical protein